MDSTMLRGRRWILVLLVSLILCVGALGVLRQQIQSGLNHWCRTAQAAHPHPGDDVAALLEYVKSETHSLEQRNHAVWALGQARTPRAVPVLEGFVTGQSCNHRHHLCQHELAKALALGKGETPNLLRIRTP